MSADPIQKLYFIDSLNIVGIGGDLEFGSGFVKSTNAGLDWVYRNLNIYGTGLGLSFRTASEAWAPIKSLFYGRFIVTYDTGNTWTNILPPIVSLCLISYLPILYMDMLLVRMELF